MTPPRHERLDIFALNVGTTRFSRAGRGFGWVSAPLLGDIPRSWEGGASRGNSAAAVMQGLAPVREQVERLGGAQSLDHTRPWSASAGALVTATGMAQAYVVSIGKGPSAVRMTSRALGSSTVTS